MLKLDKPFKMRIKVFVFFRVFEGKLFFKDHQELECVLDKVKQIFYM